MYFADLDDFLGKSAPVLAKGPVALIFVEDEVEIESTISHHLARGFPRVVVFMPDAFALQADIQARIHRVNFDIKAGQRVVDAINRVISVTPHNVWLFYCFNAEYLFYPFCEARSVGEMLTFHSEERRRGMLSYVVDAYADDLVRHPNAVSLENAYIDRTGYYALARKDPANHDHPKERQLDLYGGLRWRFEEHIPAARQRIDRIALFRVQKGLQLRADHTFNEEEYNTYSCPWHHNLTASILSFRTAKALKLNPGSTFDISTFMWRNSMRVDWSSIQLMDLGLMEPGQWF